MQGGDLGRCLVACRAFGHTDSAVIARAIRSKRTAVISIEKGHGNVAFYAELSRGRGGRQPCNFVAKANGYPGA
jgi:hypothetical protein